MSKGRSSDWGDPGFGRVSKGAAGSRAAPRGQSLSRRHCVQGQDQEGGSRRRRAARGAVRCLVVRVIV